ncbi:2-acylglycerol O-acyltransferase 2 [Pteropus alecto]|uniref:2-acylglycerol O-acyltransferase 2 n=1 Tax=Pteropus alecto TaxID=9402 RepID=L5JM19_PTEAL|nr:2-acylglycerol O-acyltransferase 2 [Pteropus alecto]
MVPAAFLQSVDGLSEGILGLVTSDKESAAHILNRKDGGNLLGVIVGGVQEALNTRPGTCTLLLRELQGLHQARPDAWVSGKKALGSPGDWQELYFALVSIFSFGENGLFDQIENSPGSLCRIQNWLQKVTSVSLPLFHGRGIFQYSFGLLPHLQPITTVVGKPIQVEKIPNPSQEEVDKLHHHYIKELCNLFEAHKLKYNVPMDQHLEFCEAPPQRRGCPKGQG